MRYSFHLNNSLIPKLKFCKKRGLSRIVNRVIERYYLIKESETVFLTEFFTLSEWGVLKGFYLENKDYLADLYRYGFLVLFLQLPIDYFNQKGIDQDTIIYKLKSLNMSQSLILIDVIDEWFELS